jgi:hypothetical protein
MLPASALDVGVMPQQSQGASTGGLDEVRALQWMRKFVTEREEAQAYIEYLRGRTFTMLRDPDVWHDVEAVAQALLEHRVLFGTEVDRVIARARALEHQRLVQAAKDAE